MCLFLSYCDSSDNEDARSPTRGDRRTPGSHQRRLPANPGSRDTLSRCRTRKMRLHVTETHLHPLFLREVPCAPDIMQARKAVLDWLCLRLLGPGTSLLEVSARVPADEVFTSSALIPDDIREVMDTFCLEVEEEPPST